MVLKRKVYRVKDPGSCVVRDPSGNTDGGLLVPLDPRKVYRHNDPFVKAYPHLFISDEDLAAEDDE